MPRWNAHTGQRPMIQACSACRDMLEMMLILYGATMESMNEREAKRTFDNTVALSTILGGDLKAICIEKGMTEEQFDILFSQHQRITEFINKHDSEGNIKLDEPGS